MKLSKIIEQMRQKAEADPHLYRYYDPEELLSQLNINAFHVDTNNEAFTTGKEEPMTLR